MTAAPLATLLRECPIVITGMGCSSAAGHSVDQLWAAAVRGAGTAQWEDFEIGGRPVRQAVCRVAGIENAPVDVRPVRRRDRSVILAWIAAALALRQAGYSEDRCPIQLGVLAGSSRGPLGKTAEAFSRVVASRYPPSLAADATFAVISGALAQLLGVRGPSSTVSATCASAGFAIAQAAEQILLGKADVMLAGGSDAPLYPAAIAQLGSAGVLGLADAAAETCRPFDRHRSGLVPGEGSAFLVLESASHARSRGAQPLARLAGWGTCVDCAGRAGVSESGAGMVDAMERAMAAGSLNPADVDHINTHGTATRLNDPAEARAIRRVFAERGAILPCSSTKPVTGHCLGATPALEAVICVEALRRQIVPPTANCREVDPECAIDVVTGAARPARLRHVMSNALGFWGCHSSLIFGSV
ncbi:MAG TPA: hypothetical protein DCY13_03620 [Verrucomicrobiales bacterium]|nr:hypothetical protein [Verrucomicrobiales bacterium]